jgi:hypothetical protein
MKNIIEDLSKLYIQNKPLSESSHFHYKAEYPIKIVHEKSRVKEDEILKKLDEKNFFNADGFSAETYDEKTVDFLRLNAANYIQTLSFAVSKMQFKDTYTFKEKFPHDRWKKIVNHDNLNAVISLAAFDSTNDICQVETALRDIMRSSKEVPALKPIGFVWVATVAKSLEISKVMQHYFLDNFTKIKTDETVTYIGWSEALQNINMRYFVCPPNK